DRDGSQPNEGQPWGGLPDGGQPEGASASGPHLDGGPILAGGLHRPVAPAGDRSEARRVSPAILLYRPEWHEGVLGIAAARLAEEFGVPTFLMARKHEGQGILVGSARTPEGFALHLALTACGEHLLRYGGHAGAAGFSLTEERFPAFRVAMLEEARRRGFTPQVEERAADLALPLEAVDRTLYDDLRRAAPFGEANPDPVLYSPTVRILSARPIGAKEQHLRLVVKAGEEAFTALWWGAGERQIPTGSEFDLYYRLHLNRWQGEEILQLVIEEVGAPIERPEGVIPLPQARPDLIDRRGAELALVYREFPGALLFWEGEGAAPLMAQSEVVAETPAPWGGGRATGHSETGSDASTAPAAEGSDPMVSRFTLRPAVDLILASPPASARLLDELIALTGAHRLILAWHAAAPPAEERFLQHLMRHLALLFPSGGVRQTVWVSTSSLAVVTGELELVVRLGLQVLADSHLLAIDEEREEQVKLRRRTDGKGIQEGPALNRLRTLLGESRAFRRFLRTGTVRAIGNAL
ncbi:MAG TPA: DHHA1 domain-containing protein, partial [Symbiobacteriaceae bacterium]|nr:DHHA1 domain-containing protein [Symbiobacteriaceae bacterium]